MLALWKEGLLVAQNLDGVQHRGSWETHAGNFASRRWIEHDSIIYAMADGRILDSMDTGSLDGAVQSFATFVRSLPAAKLEPSRNVDWGPREVLIHLVFWHEQYALIASAIAQNENPVLLKGTGRALNDAAVAREIDVPIDELLQRWTRAHARFSSVARGRRAAEIRMPLRLGAKAWPHVDLIRLAAGHIRKHQAKLEQTA